MKPTTYYCHAINRDGETCHFLKAIYNPETHIADIFRVTAHEDNILATLHAEGGLGTMALFDLCLNLIEKELGTSHIVKASLSEEKSYLIN